MDDLSKWKQGDFGVLNQDWQFFEEGEVIRLMYLNEGRYVFYFNGHGSFQVPIEIVNRVPRKKNEY
jgi:hypothetical protein